MKKTGYRSLLFIITAILTVITVDPSYSAVDYNLMRRNMVEADVKAQDIKKQDILDAMLKVPRHLFVPRKLRSLAYTGKSLSIGSQTILSAHTIALIIKFLELKHKDNVMEISTGPGYTAAVLAEIADKVYSVKTIPEFAKLSRERLELLNYKNIQVKYGNTSAGWPKKAPFNAIIVDCNISDIPSALIKQLKKGGRMIILLKGKTKRFILIKKKKDGRLITRFIH